VVTALSLSVVRSALSRACLLPVTGFTPLIPIFSHPGNYSAEYDETYKDYDGTKSIRVINPCKGDPSSWGPECQWFDDATVMSMQSQRWYSTAESLADGSVVMIGGFANG
jgi:hypothetical protein